MLDLLSGVQTLWAGASTIQYGVAAIELEFIINGLQSLLSVLVTTVTYPPVLPVSVEQRSRSQIRFRVPPVTRAGCATAGTQYTLIHPIKLGAVLLALKDLLPGHRRWVLPLQPRLNALVLVIEISHIYHQILYHEHMRQRRDCRHVGRRDLRQACEAVATVDVHCARTTDPLPARPAEREGWVNLVLDFDEGVEHHGPALLQVDFVVLQLRLRRAVRIPTVDLERLHRGGAAGLGIDLLGFRLRCEADGEGGADGEGEADGKARSKKTTTKTSRPGSVASATGDEGRRKGRDRDQVRDRDCEKQEDDHHHHPRNQMRFRLLMPPAKRVQGRESLTRA
ncbi:hypothetical protein Ahy_B04g073431 [Arachis hypogaea]|uniref:Uncharacterized protein n=1 Tax=Arachis hypogaea TaxID=3818 RepID=A0A444ZQF3_ARAHY|nr:hypothetical protein Ahy_B04g073431 [Arachis hypogaea]